MKQKEVYAEAFHQLQIELVKLQQWVVATKPPKSDRKSVV